MRSIARQAAVITIVLSMSVGLISCASGRKAGNNNYGVYHVVKPGQNLYRISLTYGVGLQQLARINGISDPAVIEVGQKIFIPGADRVLEVPVVTATVGIIPLLPAAGPITSLFGAYRSGHRHTGIDIGAPKGSPIKAVLAGVVIFSGVLKDYGRTIKIKHENGLVTLYAHNEENRVRKGQRVAQGQVIATVGRSGRASGYHVHFEVRMAGKAIDPMTLLLPSSRYGSNHVSR